MKLLSCYIAGFGKLVGQTLDLSQRVMFIKGENGWGKTTLADFLESMFYGIDGGRSKSVSENNRAKYEPWSGAKFGGTLTFEYEGKTYRVERSFGRTASADTVAVYDENCMQCYAFGERAERLGETVFGVDRESFKKTAYLSQNAGLSDGFSPAIKEKLTQLLSANKRDNGAGNALEALEKAERALRSKRKPAKGKLDEIDDKIELVRKKKEESDGAIRLLEEKRAETTATVQRLETLRRELAVAEKRLEDYARKNERYATRTARKEVENTLQTAQGKLALLRTFFGQVDPVTLNSEGLEQGITEFYALKDEIEKLLAEQEQRNERIREKQTLETKLEASRQTLESYQLLLDEQERVDRKGEKADRKNVKFAKKRVAGAMGVMVFCLIVAFAGAMLINTLQVLGIILLSGGVFGVLFALVQMFLYTTNRKRKRKRYFADAEMEQRYLNVLEEVEALEEQLRKFPKRLEEETKACAEEIERKQTRRGRLNSAITEFFSNFEMGVNYDYRAGLALLKERKNDYIAYLQTESESLAKLQTLRGDSADTEEDFSPEDMQRLALEKQAMARECERLTAEIARTETEMQTLEKTAVKRADYEAEAERLNAEKTRLEKRLTAIRYAKEILLRARSNMATKYLEPAQKGMRRYAEVMGLESFVDALRLAENGVPVAEDEGGLRELGYYSAGLKDLFGLCLRFALAECVYPNGGLLILDDPFVNLDDDKTERAKKLVYTLSERYQILYLTCKQERSL